MTSSNREVNSKLNPVTKGHKRTKTAFNLNIPYIKDDEKDKIKDQTEFVTPFKLVIANSDPISTAPGINEDNVISCLTNSVKILEKIQKEFQTSAVNNNIDINNMVKSPNCSIFSTDTSNKTTLVNPSAYVTDTEKRLISQQISDTSDYRIKNYSNIFNIINVTISDIKTSLQEVIQENHMLGKY